MWDMPITIEIVDKSINENVFNLLFSYFEKIDSIFNVYRESSEISKINRGEIPKKNWSLEIREVLAICESTKLLSNGYFEHVRNGMINPLGIVKGWAIKKASDVLLKMGHENYYLDAGGDVQTHGCNSLGERWKVGIRNPFNRFENVKILSLTNCGIATSGNYIRGNHIYNPQSSNKYTAEIVSLTIIGPDVFEADRFATPAFAMGRRGIYFIEDLPGFEGYMIDDQGKATYTSGFERYVLGGKNSSYPPLNP